MPPRRPPPPAEPHSAPAEPDPATSIHSHVLSWDYGSLVAAAADAHGAAAGTLLGRPLPPLPPSFASVKAS